MLLHVLRTLRAHQMVARGGRVLVALSGGRDSVALLHILRELEQQGELTVAGVGHFNHRLRGAAADDDEQFCRELAAALGLPVEIGSADVRAFAARQRRSIEDAARAARYAFLEEAADRVGADAIAVGHSRDDQAETFLLRLLRGAGPRGLAGIRPRAGRVIRPLIEIPREQLRAYVAERGLAFREDASNADVRIPRNRVRHELLPVLRGFSPAVVQILAREAGIARRDEEFLGRAAVDLAERIVLPSKSGFELDAAALRELHPALGARVVREALERAAPGRQFGHGHIESALSLASQTGSVSLPGLELRREGARLVVAPGRSPEPFANPFRFPLSIPGEVALPGWGVSAELDSGNGAGPLEARGVTVAVGAATVSLPLAVRNRQRGDRFRPLGMGGRGRKLQDFLVDRKVARRERDTLPLVVDSDDRIVWVVGQSVAEDFRVTDPSQGVILLKARRLGGEG